MRRELVVVAVLASLGMVGSVGRAQTPRAGAPRAAAPWPERAVRRDLPLPPTLRRALAAGTRDSSGRPGPKYWQLGTDYTIDARLDPATATVSGHERIVIRNPTDSALAFVCLRLDQNFFTPTAMRRGDTLYQVAQWYPRVVVFDDLYPLGWNAEPYLGQAEFYNNFGRFDVRLELPAGWLVGATGMLQNPEAVLAPPVRARLAHILESPHRRPGRGEHGHGRAREWCRRPAGLAFRGR